MALGLLGRRERVLTAPAVHLVPKPQEVLAPPTTAVATRPNARCVLQSRDVRAAGTGRRLMPSIFAAAERFPSTCRRISMMCSRSTSPSAGGVTVAEGTTPLASRVRGRTPTPSCLNVPANSRSDSMVPSASIHARSIAFLSSRTLPSHRPFRSSRSALVVSPVIGFPIRFAQSRTKAAVRYGMSSRRSRNVGTVTSTIFRR